ncbi:PLD nuclease N-terminal domain-containing protein [Nocardia jejuensis]|uniref:PLD nuclease N-terminal domain-containing protein n=1 Tax=Nocardia jejuensis TaxID=328049 RepID=UPI000A028C8B|nr:PLD nuclease N-terminal domain-containing protein [Nocardia jejuensis]
MTTLTLASGSTLADTGDTTGSVVVVVIALAFALAGAVLFLAGVVSVLRSGNYASGGKAVWVLAMLAFPLVGPLAWFVWGRKSTMSNPPSAG